MVQRKEEGVKGVIVVKSERGGGKRNRRQRHKGHEQYKPIPKSTSQFLQRWQETESLVQRTSGVAATKGMSTVQGTGVERCRATTQGRQGN